MWDELPDDVKKRILTHAITGSFEGKQVPLVREVARLATVSKGMREETKSFLAENCGVTSLLLRQPPANIFRELLQGLVHRRLTNARCAELLDRLALLKELQAMSDVASEMQSLASNLRRDLITVEKASSALLHLLHLCHLIGVPSMDDAKGVRQIVAEIVERYPRDQYLYVAIGASADPIAIGLAVTGCQVVYLKLSGVEDTDAYRLKQIGYVSEEVQKWPASRRLLLMDALNTGTALIVTSKLIRMAHKNLRRPEPMIVRFGVNRPTDSISYDEGAALERFAKGEVVSVAGTTPEARNIHKKIASQELKEDMGRLYEKHNTNAQMDTGALSRMVAEFLGSPLLRYSWRAYNLTARPWQSWMDEAHRGV